MLTYDVEWARDCLPWSPGGLRLFDLGVQGARYCSVLVFRGWVLFNPGIQAAGECSHLMSREQGVCPPLVFRGLEIV